MKILCKLFLKLSLVIAFTTRQVVNAHFKYMSTLRASEKHVTHIIRFRITVFEIIRFAIDIQNDVLIAGIASQLVEYL